MAWFMGIDVGSGNSKGVLTEDRKPAAFHLIPSGINYRVTGERLITELLAKASLSQKDIAYVVATGYGGESVALSNERADDIRCCARGINSTLPAVRTVIDLQGVSSQVIRLDEKGRVIDFAISEKCAAGSGRFLNVIANVLRIDLDDIGPLSLKAKNPVTFTTGCAVFGESEAISRVSEGTAPEDILAGVHKALANKVATLVDRVGLEEECVVSGGGALNVGLVKSITEKLGILLILPPNPQFITALGAAIIAWEREKLK